MRVEASDASIAPDRGTLISALRRLGRVADTLPRLWVLVSLAAVFMLLARMQVWPPDFWWHVRTGQWIVEHGRVPRSDLFSFTRLGEPWAYQSWLMELVLYGLLRAGGLPLVIFANAVTITAAYALLLWTCERASGGWLRVASISTVAAAAATFVTWSARPQMISFPLFALTLCVIDGHARRTEDQASTWRSVGRLWCLPPAFALWANAHGGFVFGLALLGTTLCVQLVDWLRRRSPFPTSLTAITALSAAATLLTPLGFGMGDYVLGFVRHPVTVSFNAEFAPPTVRTLPGQLFFGFVIVWIGVLIVSRYRPSLRESLRLLLFGLLALWGIRNAIWFAFVAAPTTAASLRAWTARCRPSRPQRIGRRGVNRLFAAVVGVLTLLTLPWLRPYTPLPWVPRGYLSPNTPVEAVDVLCGLPDTGRVFHTEVYGSYMVWACPEVPVFVDTRFELYPEEQWMDFLALLMARYDWQAILDRYGIDTLLLPRERLGQLIEAATAAPEWERLYKDDQAVILRRVEGP